MSELVKAKINKQQYASADAGNLMTGTKRVIVAILPRSILVAAIGDNGQVLAIRYSDYTNVPVDWIIDFFEHQFLNEPLLNDPTKITTVFVATEKNMLVPSTLYNAEASELWLKKIHFVENDDVVSTQPLSNDKAYYIYAWPLMIKDLAKRYFPKAKVLPFATYQFNKSFNGAVAQCCVSNQQAFITLYQSDKLLWHEVYAYNNAEDIAYRIKYLAGKSGIADIGLRCTTTNSELAFMATKLSQYFTDVQVGDSTSFMNASGWDAAISVVKQLYTCA